MKDSAITLILWTYFTLGFILFFSPFYFLAFLFSKNREAAFQHLSHLFYRIFFFLVRGIIPGHTWHVEKQVREITSSVIICNHRSYLDSIFLISLFRRHKTIAKGTLFSIPFFGWMLKYSGYIPSPSGKNAGRILIQHMEDMHDFFAEGGNLFVFPEGTRIKNGTVGEVNQGAFKIARLFQVPIEVLLIRNTEKLFQPGNFLFNTQGPNAISLQKLDTIHPDPDNKTAISKITAHVRGLFLRVAEQDQNS